MKKSPNIYRFLLVLISLALIAGCLGQKKAGEEQPPVQEKPEIDNRGYDPLELPADRQVIPREDPRGGVIQGKGALVSTVEQPPDTSAEGAVEIPVDIDTLANQTYRVQLFTSKVYGEARQAETVAKEIFDRPVYLDYEVPYYKLRVGDFATREAAEDYQQKAKSAGYANAWVVLVIVDVKEARPMYEELPDEMMPDTVIPGSDQVPQ
jgi:hypothetical protein